MRRLYNMRLSLLICAVFVISACQSLSSTDPDSLAFSIPPGSILSLNRPLDISSLNTHALIQAGMAISENEKNEYDINCRLDMKKFGPRTLEPEDFTITRSEDGFEWFSHDVIMRFYTELYLASSKGTDVIKLECQQWGDGNDWNFTVAEMASALGDYFSFTFEVDN